MWLNAYFKFTDQAAFMAAWPETLKTPEGTAMPMGEWQGCLCVVDSVGPFYTDAVYDPEGALVTAPLAGPGWHVNVRIQGPHMPLWPAAVAAAEISEPAYPRRVFAE